MHKGFVYDSYAPAAKEKEQAQEQTHTGHQHCRCVQQPQVALSLHSSVCALKPNCMQAQRNTNLVARSKKGNELGVKTRQADKPSKRADTETHTQTWKQRHARTHTRTRTHAHRHTDTQTHRHTDTQTHTHTHSYPLPPLSLFHTPSPHLLLVAVAGQSCGRGVRCDVSDCQRR